MGLPSSNLDAWELLPVVSDWQDWRYLWKTTGIDFDAGRPARLSPEALLPPPRVYTRVSLPCIVTCVGTVNPIPPAEQPSTPDDPHRNLFWMFLSFMGISLPKAGQQRRAMLMIIIGVLLFLAFIAAGILTVFRFW